MMTDQQLHHLTNHLPSIGLIIGILVMIISLMFKKHQSLATGAIIVLLAGLSVLAANKTGEDTEEKIEHLPGISEKSIHEHEEAAEQVLPFALVSAGFALLFLLAYWKEWKWANLAATASILVGAIAIYFLIIASHNGGLIRHPELDGAVITNTNGGSGTENEGDDD